MLYNQIQDLQNNGKITKHPTLRHLLKADEIKNRFNLKHQNKLLTPTLKAGHYYPYRWQNQYLHFIK